MQFKPLPYFSSCQIQTALLSGLCFCSLLFLSPYCSIFTFARLHWMPDPIWCLILCFTAAAPRKLVIGSAGRRWLRRRGPVGRAQCSAGAGWETRRKLGSGRRQTTQLQRRGGGRLSALSALSAPPQSPAPPRPCGPAQTGAEPPFLPPRGVGELCGLRQMRQMWPTPPHHGCCPTTKQNKPFGLLGKQVEPLPRRLPAKHRPMTSSPAAVVLVSAHLG